MALIKCGECGSTASTSAKACPGCGAGAKAMRKGRSRWPTTRRGWALLGFTGLMVAGAASSMIGGSPPPQLKTAEDLASDKRNHAAYAAAAAIKRSLRETDSAIFEKVRVDDAAETVCIVYRARNGFGGMGIGHVLYHSGVPSARATDWNRRCAHKDIYELNDIAQLVPANGRV